VNGREWEQRQGNNMGLEISLKIGNGSVRELTACNEMSKAATGHLYRVYTRYVRCQNAVDPACVISVLSASHTASRTSCRLWYHALDHSVMTYLRHFHHTCRHWSAAARSCLVAMSCIQTSISPEASCAGGAYSHVQRVGDEGGDTGTSSADVEVT